MAKYFLSIIFSLGLIGCNSLYYHPSQESIGSPERFGYKPMEVWFPSENPIHGWVFEPLNTSTCEGLVVHFHGNAENITTHFAAVAWLSRHGYRVLTFDYRGYGKSRGVPTRKGILADSLAVIHNLNSLKCDKLIFYGQSLGGNIMVNAWYSGKLDPDLALVDSSFLGYPTVGSRVLRRHWITFPLSWLPYILVSPSPSAARAIKNSRPSALPVPTLFIHSVEDSVVEFENGQDFYKAYPGKKYFWKILEPGHTNSMFVKEGTHRSRLLTFLKSGSF